VNPDRIIYGEPGRPRIRPFRGLGPAAAWIALLALLTPFSLSGQGFQRLVDECSNRTGGFTGRCHVGALALDALRGGVAAAASFGSEVPGSASTVGYRLQSFPRTALSFRMGLARFSVPDILSSYTLPVGDRTLNIPTLQLSGVAGVFNGFAPLPTVGGVLSLDLTASAQHLFAGKEDGFRGGLWGWGLGARVGLLRESFTLPGVTISVARRWIDRAQWGEPGPSSPLRLDLENQVTSLRTVVGKDLFGIGFFGGAGWDWLSGAGTLAVRPSPGEVEVVTTRGGLESKRFSYFAGASRTFLILQVSGEVGWSESLDSPLPVNPLGNKYPSARALFGSLALRVTF